MRYAKINLGAVLIGNPLALAPEWVRSSICVNDSLEIFGVYINIYSIIHINIYTCWMQKERESVCGDLFVDKLTNRFSQASELSKKLDSK